MSRILKKVTMFINIKLLSTVASLALIITSEDTDTTE